jgi:catechol 2,3-dioxygenase-like lactoylglutathione lyase family enzyme
VIAALDHVQVAAPPGCETDARRFYGDLLGLEEVEKPAPLQARGGAWFRCGAQQRARALRDDERPWAAALLLARWGAEVLSQSAVHRPAELPAVVADDNLPALRLDQRHGFALVALNAGAIEQARALKPSIPASGHEGIAIRDELALERVL